MSRRVLIIDDEEAIQTIVKVSLELTAGWTVLTTSSSTEGLEKAKKEQPDAILLDVMMPETDGVTLLHQLRTEPLTQDIPVIFLTAQARASERQSLEAIATGLILKPFEPDTIAKQVREILNWS